MATWYGISSSRANTRRASRSLRRCMGRSGAGQERPACARQRPPPSPKGRPAGVLGPMAGRAGPTARAKRHCHGIMRGMESAPAAPDGAIPADRTERRDRRRIAGFWVALFSGTAAANVLVRYMRAARDHETFDWFAGIVDEGSSALVSLLL